MVGKFYVTTVAQIGSVKLVTPPHHWQNTNTQRGLPASTDIPLKPRRKSLQIIRNNLAAQQLQRAVLACVLISFVVQNQI